MASENVYRFDVFSWGKSLLPGFYRKPKRLALIQVLLRPTKKLAQEFEEFRHLSTYKQNHNSQIPYLTGVMNDAFDHELRRIFITNAEVRTPLFFYEAADEKPVFFYETEHDKPVYFREESEFLGGGSDFTVWVPLELKPQDEAELTAFLTRMRAQIDYFKLYAKSYVIQFI